MKLDFILYNKSLSLVVDGCREFGGDGMMRGCVLHDQPLVTCDSGKDSWLFHRPFADIGPVLVTLGVLLFGMRRSPSRVPIVGELF